MRQELETALTLAMQAGRATPDERKRIMGALKDGDARQAEKYIPTTEAAAILESCGKTVFRYEQRGLLHAVRRSKRCIRWRKSEVEKLAMNGVAVSSP